MLNPVVAGRFLPGGSVAWSRLLWIWLDMEEVGVAIAAPNIA
jgi:hypothetical protein